MSSIYIEDVFAVYLEDMSTINRYLKDMLAV
jgi:hypothetical protein